MGEDGEWYFWVTGSDGERFNLTHVFYATATDAVNIATIQEVSSVRVLQVNGALPPHLPIPHPPTLPLLKKHNKPLEGLCPP